MKSLLKKPTPKSDYCFIKDRYEKCNHLKCHNTWNFVKSLMELKASASEQGEDMLGISETAKKNSAESSNSPSEKAREGD